MDFDRVLDILDVSVKKYGAKTLAPELNKGHSTLRNELNPNLQEQYKLGLLTAILIMKHTGDLSALDTIEEMFERVAYPLPKPDPWKPCQVMELMSIMSKEFSESLKAQADGIADGVFDKEEARNCIKENSDMIKACLKWQAYLEALLK